MIENAGMGSASSSIMVEVNQAAAVALSDVPVMLKFWNKWLLVT